MGSLGFLVLGLQSYHIWHKRWCWEFLSATEHLFNDIDQRWLNKHFEAINLIIKITGAFGVILAATLLYLVRKDHLHISHGLGWTITILLCALLGFAPGIFDSIALTAGVNYAPILGITLAIAALIVKALIIDIELTKLKIKQQRLVQKIAILEVQVTEITKEPLLKD